MRCIQLLGHGKVFATYHHRFFEVSVQERDDNTMGSLDFVFRILCPILD